MIIYLTTQSSLDDDCSWSSYMKVMLLQAHHHTASYHEVTLSYTTLMWLIVHIHVMSL
jgi:hypothetical protein